MAKWLSGRCRKNLNMKDRDFAIAYLKSIEKKHHDYFDTTHLDIMKCVRIEGNEQVSMQVINDNLPPAIRYDIEVMFWRTEHGAVSAGD
ncbi:MAG: hypothetical protein M3N14_00915 [Bacteroidota bacterium]|nr:hypothetical protein [Bacteroidota bacterium]